MQAEPPIAEPVAAERKPMTMEALLAVVNAEMGCAAGPSLSSVISTRGANALDVYLGQPYGNERDGRSSVVMRDAFEVIEWMHPDIVDVFTGNDEIVKFRAVGPEDEAEAAQQSDAVNFAVTIENDWFRVWSNWSKDGLIRQGIAKVWWEESVAFTYEDYESVSANQIAMMQQDADVLVVAATPLDEAGMLYDVTIRRSKTSGQVRIEPIPGEEFLIEKEARSIRTARFVAHVPGDMTASKLREMGYDEDVVSRMFGSPVPENNAEGEARRAMEDGGTDSWSRDVRSDSERGVSYVEAYVRVDLDGDGISELVKVCCGGAGNMVSEILHVEPCRVIPFASLTPICVPHRFQGIGEVEVVADIQEIHTAVMRQGLDGLYLGNYPRFAVLTSGGEAGSPQANLDQLMNIVPMGYVEEYTPGAIRPLISEDTSTKAVPFLEILRQMREERTGVNRFTQGMEAPEINKTATGLIAMQGAANKRIKFVARVFAEGVKDLMRIVAGLLKQHQRQQKTIRLRGEWVDVDPTTWEHDYDCTIEVGFGPSDKAEAIANVDGILAYQEKAAALAPQLVDPAKAYNALSERVKLMGYSNPERFFNDPAKTEPPPEQPSVEERQLEAYREIELRKLEVKELEVKLEHERKLYELIGEWIPAPEPQEPPAPMGMAAA